MTSDDTTAALITELRAALDDFEGRFGSRTFGWTHRVTDASRAALDRLAQLEATITKALAVIARDVDRLHNLDPVELRRILESAAVSVPAVTDEQMAAAMFDVESKHHFHGIQCLCGFESHRSRSRTEHITAEIRAALHRKEDS